MGANNLAIQRMVFEDLPQVLAIEQAAFPTPFSEDLFRKELETSVARPYVARQGTKILGYIDYWHIDREMHVITLAIHPESRRQGIAAQLMQFMIEEAKKNFVELITLEVRMSNKAAQNLYRKFHFAPVGIRKKYHQDNGEDALVMNLSL